MVELHTTKINFLTISISFLLGFPLFSFSQNLCETDLSKNPNYQADGFELLTPETGCGQYTVKLNDKTGGTNIKYSYYYQGEALTDSDSSLPVNNTQNTYFEPEKTSNYTILQFGQNNAGEDFYSCKNVTVYPNSKPKFSFSTCNNNVLEISIPLDSTNDFEFYEIDWGNANIQTVNKTDLPFSDTTTVDEGQTFSVEGFRDENPSSCISKSSFQIDSNSGQKESLLSIEKLELIDSKTAELSFTGSYSSSGYSLFLNENSGTIDLDNSVLNNVQPGKVQISLPDESKSFCITLARGEVCGGQERSPDFCTTPITSLDTDGINNSLEFIPHKNEFYDIISLIPSFGKRENSLELIYWDDINNKNDSTINASNGQITHPFLCEKSICYQLKTTSKGFLANKIFETIILSNVICINDSSFSPEGISDLYSSFSQTENKVDIIFQDDSDWLPLRDNYYLYREIGLDYELVDSSKVLSFSDYLYNESSSNCYKVNFKDVCGYNSVLSPEVCTIYLETDFSTELTWETAKPFFPKIISNFEILQINEFTEAQTSIYNGTNFVSDTFEPNLDDAESEAHFLIKVTNSIGQDSYSNPVTIPIKTKLFIPNAFSPNGNIEKTKDFRLFGNFGTLQSFNINIYNKWGALVFNSTSPAFKWDGTFKGQTVSQGVYPYTLSYTSKKGEITNLSGAINIF
ncbi:T9SS type B sorting domain-containing protein [Arcticibacterium luteifluviistationis]|nr:gliding motility-associated C-terminal domain-containing protein [Arcticibacterium luteifluviistationis]